jgi:hypothetical protein
MGRQLNLQASEKQSLFLNLNSQLGLFLGGVGSGKTAAGAIWMLCRALKYPKALGFIGANTYGQLSKSTLPPFYKLLRDNKIRYVHGKHPPKSWPVNDAIIFEEYDNVLTLDTGAQIVTYSLENWEVYRGIQVASVWIDETRDSKPEAFDELLQRLRGYDTYYPGLPYQLRATTTPNGFDWLYDKFIDDKTKLNNSSYVTATSYDNPFLPESYARDLESKLGKNLAQQQIYARIFTLCAGRAFAFDRLKHVKPLTIRYDLPLIWSMDFNVSPLCGIIAQADKAKREIYFLDEVVIPDNAQTRDCCNEFIRRYKTSIINKSIPTPIRNIPVTPAQGQRWPRIVELYGDVAGKHRDTRGSQSDWTIMLESIRQGFSGVAEVRDCQNGKGEIVDGINALNALLEPAIGLPRLLVDNKCSTLIQDFEQMAFVPGTREIDKKNKRLGHINDAARYIVQQLFPVCQVTIGGVN